MFIYLSTAETFASGSYNNNKKCSLYHLLLHYVHFFHFSPPNGSLPTLDPTILPWLLFALFRSFKYVRVNPILFRLVDTI